MWTRLPLIFLAYLAVLLYFVIFQFQLLILAVFLCSLLVALWRKYWLLLPILLVLTGFFGFVRADSQRKMLQQPEQISQIAVIPDSIQVNGALLGFQGRADGQKFQVYYTLKNEAEQKFYQNLTQNAQLTFIGTVELPEAQRNFNGFDYQKYLVTQQIYRQIKIQSIQKVELNNRFDLHLLRRKAIVWTQNHFPAPMSSYMTGLLFGYFSKDFGEMRDIYSSLGIVHLFALSGMHVNFFIVSLRRFLLRIGVCREQIGFFQIPFSIFYAFMARLSISVMRALIQKNIRWSGLDNVAVMTLILLVIRPQFLLTVGGQLTLLYAFGLAMLSGRFKVCSGLKRSLLESVMLSLLVLPLLIFDFHIFQPFSILLTFAFGLLFNYFLLPLLLGAFLLSLTGLTFSLNSIFKGLEQLVVWVDKPLHYPPIFGTPTIFQFLLLLVFAGLLIDHFHSQKAQILILSALTVLLLTVKYPAHPSITMVDVGQGDSIFIQDKWNRQNILIDTGGKLAIPAPEWQKTQTQSNAEKTLIPYLQSMGVGQIDQIILTHTDADHMGDFLSLADKIKIKQVWVSPGELTNSQFVKTIKTANIPIHIVKTGDQIPIFDSQLQFLSQGYTGKGDNNDSMVTYGEFYGKKFLFTGDLEQDGEMQLLQHYPNLKVDVLKAGHHGSKTSSKPEFIQKIQPELALISVGKNNRYKHPNQETLDTFESNQIRSIRTDQHGAIKFIKKQNHWQIETVK